MTLNQAECTEKILERFGISESKPHDTPMVTRQAKNKNVNNRLIRAANKNKIEIPYGEAIGSLLYLANVTRQNISFAVSYLERKQSNHSEEDWSEVKRIFRYLRGTTNLGLIYRGKSENLESFTDSSFRDHLDSTSTSGIVVFLFGDTIIWRSHKQGGVNPSTCHTEYFAMSEACQEAISLDKAFKDIVKPHLSGRP